MEELYPIHCKALLDAGLVKNNKILTLEKILKNIKNPARIEAAEERENDYKDKRNTFFCIAASRRWLTSLTKLLQKKRKEYKL